MNRALSRTSSTRTGRSSADWIYSGVTPGHQAGPAGVGPAPRRHRGPVGLGISDLMTLPQVNPVDLGPLSIQLILHRHQVRLPLDHAAVQLTPVLRASTSTKTQTCPTPTISAGWLPRTRSTPSRRRRCSPSLTTEASTTGWSPTTQPRNGPSQRPPTPASTPMPSLSVSNATGQAHSPRTGPRCSRRSKKGGEAHRLMPLPREPVQDGSGRSRE